MPYRRIVAKPVHETNADVRFYWCLNALFQYNVTMSVNNGLVQERRNSIVNALELRLDVLTHRFMTNKDFSA